MHLKIILFYTSLVEWKEVENLDYNCNNFCMQKMYKFIYSMF